MLLFFRPHSADGFGGFFVVEAKHGAEGFDAGVAIFEDGEEEIHVGHFSGAFEVRILLEFVGGLEVVGEGRGVEIKSLAGNGPYIAQCIE